MRHTAWAPLIDLQLASGPPTVLVHALLDLPSLSSACMRTALLDLSSACFLCICCVIVICYRGS